MRKWPRARRRAPWLSSVEESDAALHDQRRPVRPLELIAVLIVTASVIAFFVWFLLLASGGPGPGTM